MGIPIHAWMSYYWWSKRFTRFDLEPVPLAFVNTLPTKSIYFPAWPLGIINNNVLDFSVAWDSCSTTHPT